MSSDIISAIGRLPFETAVEESKMRSTNYARLVKALRQRRGMTQEALAREIGVSFATLNKWENGRRRPQPYLARRIAEIAVEAGLDPGEFADDDG